MVLTFQRRREKMQGSMLLCCAVERESTAALWMMQSSGNDYRTINTSPESWHTRSDIITMLSIYTLSIKLGDSNSWSKVVFNALKLWCCYTCCSIIGNNLNTSSIHQPSLVAWVFIKFSRTPNDRCNQNQNHIKSTCLQSLVRFERFYLSVCRPHLPMPVQYGWECCSSRRPQIWGRAPRCEALETLSFGSSPEPTQHLYLQPGRAAPPLWEWWGSGSLEKIKKKIQRLTWEAWGKWKRDKEQKKTRWRPMHASHARRQKRTWTPITLCNDGSQNLKNQGYLLPREWIVGL